jgi:ubiquinone/menaquinone biosynthesis C-methylase UbiE
MPSANNPVIEYYNELAPAYDQYRFENSYGRYIHQQETAFLKQVLNGRKAANILDLACGTGRLLHFATHGADASEAMITQARVKQSEKTFATCEANQLPFENGFFNTVFSFHLLMHLDNTQVQSIFAEVARVLQPGGLFIFDMPSAKRRQLLGKKVNGWHGALSFTYGELKTLTAAQWQWKQNRGVLFLPVHRLPNSLRAPLRGIDNLLCRSFLKEYASYHMVVLQKKSHEGA